MPIPRIAEPRRAEQSRSEEGERASGRGAQVFRQISIEVRANGAGIHSKWKSHPGRHTRRSKCRQCPIREMVQWLVADRFRCGGPRGRHYRGETGLCADSRRKLGDGTPVQLYPGMLGREAPPRPTAEDAQGKKSSGHRALRWAGLPSMRDRGQTPVGPGRVLPRSGENPGPCPPMRRPARWASEERFSRLDAGQETYGQHACGKKSRDPGRRSRKNDSRDVR